MITFVSYARKDAELATRIAAVLRQSKYAVWMDSQVLQPGVRWPEEISRNIRGCDVFLLVISRNSVASRQVVNELTIASEADRRIVPLRLDRTHIPDSMLLFLSGLQYIDYSSSHTAEALLGLKKAGGRPAKRSAHAAQKLAPQVVQSVPISAPPEYLFRVAATVEAYPEWHSGVRTVKTLDVDKFGRATHVRWGVGLFLNVTFFEYVVRYTYESPWIIRWETEPNDWIQEMIGCYEFIPISPHETQAVCSLRLVDKLRLPAFVHQHLVTLITSTRLTDLKARAEIPRPTDVR